MSDLVGQADGKQHVAGVQAAGGACRAGGGTDAAHVQHEQQAFALGRGEAGVHIVGQAFAAVQWAVHFYLGHLLDMLQHIVAHPGKPCALFVKAVHCGFQRCGQADNAREVFSTRAASALLRAAVQKIQRHHAAADIQRPHALRSVELVG